MKINPNTDIVAVQDTLESCGAVSYWRASGSIAVADLRQAWIDAGLDPKLLRKEPDAKTVLRRAVLGLADRKKVDAKTEIRTLVRPDAEPHTWAVVCEVVTTDDLPRYTTLLTVMYDSTSNGPMFEATEDAPPGSETYDRLKTAVYSAFAAQQGLFDPGDITGWLVKLAYANNAVTLRDSGGVYFVPKPAMDFWNKAADVIEHVSNGAHRVFRIPAMRTADAVAAITDAVTAEAQAFVADVEKELAATGDDELGRRALKTRQAQADALLTKVASYEKLLGLQMEIREKVTSLSATVAAAALA